MSQPVNDDLRRWIESQSLAGHAPAALLKSMIDSGWQAAVAEAALMQVLQPGAAPVRAAAADAAAAVAVAQVPYPDLAGDRLRLDAGDRIVRVLQVMRSPRLVVFGDLLSEGECEGLVTLARQRLARSLTVETKTGGESMNVDRTSEGMFFERSENELVTRIETRIAKLLNWPIEFGEGLQILRYRAGAQYRPHFDYFDPREPGTPTILRRGGQRVGTLIMYLQEPDAGGATVFPDVGLEVACQRGGAVFFAYDRPDPSTMTLHGGSPVQQGEKWVATKWLREREFR